MQVSERYLIVGPGRTVRVPNVTRKLHDRRHERVVLGELDLGGENASFIWRALGTLYEGFPEEQVVFVDGAGGDAIRRILREMSVLLKEPLGGNGVHGALELATDVMCLLEYGMGSLESRKWARR